MNVRDLLVDQSEDVFARTSRRLAGLTNDELAWEPAPHFPAQGRAARLRPTVAAIGGACRCLRKPGLGARCHGQLQDPSGAGGEDDRKPAAAATSD